MLTALDVDVAPVLAVNEAFVAPGGTVTLAGTVANVVLLLAKEIRAPPCGAGALRATLPKDGAPPMTLLGLSVREVRLGPEEDGVTLRVAVCCWVTPDCDAEMLTVVELETAAVVT